MTVLLVQMRGLEHVLGLGHALPGRAHLRTGVEGPVDLASLLLERLDVPEERHQSASEDWYSEPNCVDRPMLAFMRAFQPSEAACQSVGL